MEGLPWGARAVRVPRGGREDQLSYREDEQSICPFGRPQHGGGPQTVASVLEVTTMPKKKSKRLPPLTPRAREVVNFVINAVALGTHDDDAEIGVIAERLGTTP